MKVHILHEFKDGPWGGGNQFLKAIREQWRKKGIYAENFEEADSYLLNAFPLRHLEYFTDPLKIKKAEEKAIFYRLDGLFYKNRMDEKEKYIDDICALYANSFVDGVIYQTNWIKKIQQNHGISENISNIVCINAPDSQIFKKQELSFPKEGEKIKLVATCWAPNERKGFKYYKYLDENLDFNKYEMTFIGNSPIEFKNIKMKSPLSTVDLAKELTKYHVFVSCAFDEPCSNSLLEAMHLGLPAIVHNSGGSPELIGGFGVAFNDEKDIISSINELSKKIKECSEKIKLPFIEEIAENYYQFMLSEFNKGVKPLDNQKVKEFNKLLKKNFKNDCKLVRKIKQIILRVFKWIGLKK